MAEVEPNRCAYCGAPTKKGRVCRAHADVAVADQELSGNADAATWPLARSTESRQDDAPSNSPGGAP